MFSLSAIRTWYVVEPKLENGNVALEVPAIVKEKDTANKSSSEQVLSLF